MGIRELKEQARRDLHQAMQVPALYLGPEGADPIHCTVRIHTSDKALGDMRGTSFAYAERHEEITRMIFLADEVDPDNRAVVSITAGEAYRIDNVHPRDGLTVTAEVFRLPRDETFDLPVPEGA